jgi:hypothetical protein
MSTSYKEIVELIRAKRFLPDGFQDWELADYWGWTVAHEAAKHGCLPPDFDRWELATNSGWTVAHVAAEHGHLPPDFDRWELA